MSSRYPRNTSPQGRRGTPPARASTGHFAYSSNDPYYNRSTRDNYTSPRSSGERVIPISSETYVNGVPLSSSRSSPSQEPYSDYGRRATASGSDLHHRQGSLTNPSRSRPHITQGLGERPSSPHGKPRYDKDYYATPASSSHSRREHKKTYSTDEGKPIRLIEDGSKDHRERDDPDKGHRHDMKGYHPNDSPKAANIDDHGAYEYTDARGMYHDTEPRWRPRRRGSADSAERPRPISLVDDYPRSGTRDQALSPPMRKPDYSSNGIVRHGSLRDDKHKIHGLKDRGYRNTSQDETYDVRPRIPTGRIGHLHRDKQDSHSSSKEELEDRRESRHSSRRFEDSEVASRGFGIRAVSVEPEPSRGADTGHRSGHGADGGGMLVVRSDVHSERPREDHHLGSETSDRENFYDKDRTHGKERENNTGARDLDRYRNSNDAIHDGDRRARESRSSIGPEVDRFEKARTTRRPNYGDAIPSSSNAALGTTAIAAAVGLGGSAAYANHAADKCSRARSQSDSNQSHTRDDIDPAYDSPDEASGRERHYVRREDALIHDSHGYDSRTEVSSEAADPDEEYRQRIRREVEQSKQSKPGRQSEPSDASTDELSARSMRRVEERNGRTSSLSPERNYSSKNRRDYDFHANEFSDDDPTRDDSKALARIHNRHDSILDEPLTDEPAQVLEQRGNRVRIVEPPREKEAPKSILRKPTEKFPEDPNPIREGVAPLKDSNKKGVPTGARWTKIARRLVNPEALKEAKERFEERQDCVIVLRVLTKEEIQKFADRTKELRDERYERDHRDRKHHAHHSSRDSRRRDHDGHDDEHDDTSGSEDGDKEGKPRQIAWH